MSSDDDDLFSETERFSLKKSSALSTSFKTEREALARSKETQSFIQLIRNAQDADPQCRQIID